MLIQVAHMAWLASFPGPIRKIGRGLGTRLWHGMVVHRSPPFLESSQGFTEIKRVRNRSIQVCQGSLLGTWNTFVLRIEHPYIVGKSLDKGELTFHVEKSACYQLQQQTKVHALPLALQTTLENCTKSTQ